MSGWVWRVLLASPLIATAGPALGANVSAGCATLMPGFTMFSVLASSSSVAGPFLLNKGDRVSSSWSGGPLIMQVINSSSAVVSDVDGQSPLISSPLSAEDNYTIKIVNQSQATVQGNFGCTVGEAHNFNGDGKSDILWRQTDGTTAIWLMNGAQVTQSGSLGTVGTSWQIVGQRDFDSDGKSDLLWRDTSGNTAIWFMNGTTVASTGAVGNISINWTVVATGDFNGDGKGDILWRDTSGNLAVWLMNGATVSASAGIGNVPNIWTVAGIGDFNGDGKSDILWIDNAFNIVIWFMNGATVASTAGVGNVDGFGPGFWSVAGIGDFNGDGKSDIFWRYSLGQTAIWLMNGASVLSPAWPGNIPTTWSIVQTGDYDGNGTSDVLWRDTSGNTSIWFMNGTAITSMGAVGNISTNWTVQSANSE
jgi:FG-GAP-like repeat